MDSLWSIILSMGTWLQANWVPLAAGLWLVEQGFRVVSKITPWKWDDNLVDILAKILSSIAPKKVT